MRQTIASGKTTDDAIENGCAELGVSRDDINVSVEILDLPQKKLFGSIPAKVKITVDEDSFSVRDLVRGVEPKEQESKKEEPEKQEPKKEELKSEQKPARHEEKPTPLRQEKTAEPEKEPEPEKLIELDSLPAGGKAALEYLKAVAEKLGAVELTYSAAELENGVKLLVDGQDAAKLIGRRGEVMDSLQYLCLLVSNRASEDYCKITIDVANYRKKREGSLESLARRIAAKVKKTKYSQTLEPMNPYERRIVHSAVQLIDGVRSESVGEDPNRRVVIMLEGGGRGRDFGRNGRRGDRNHRGHGQGRPERSCDSPKPAADAPKPVEAKPAESAPAKEKKADSADEKMLYGKIEL